MPGLGVRTEHLSDTTRWMNLPNSSIAGLRFLPRFLSDLRQFRADESGVGEFSNRCLLTSSEHHPQHSFDQTIELITKESVRTIRALIVRRVTGTSVAEAKALSNIWEWVIV